MKKLDKKLLRKKNSMLILYGKNYLGSVLLASQGDESCCNGDKGCCDKGNC